MSPLQEATVNPMREKAASTYNAAADHFDSEPAAFWRRHGQRSVELAELSPGDRVLDAGCGTGTSALPAAAAVGPEGHVVGIDIADNMLIRARKKAKGLGLTNTTFISEDMAACSFADETFDAVISVFSVFFVRDIERHVAELWRMVRTGGKLVVTVWGRGAFEPAAPIFGAELCKQQPGFDISVRPWERLTDPEKLRRLFDDAGVPQPAVHRINDQQTLQSPEDWWTIAMGSGYRGEIERLTPAQQRALRSDTIGALAAKRITSIETSALCAIARK